MSEDIPYGRGSPQRPDAGISQMNGRGVQSGTNVAELQLQEQLDGNAAGAGGRPDGFI